MVNLSPYFKYVVMADNVTPTHWCLNLMCRTCNVPWPCNEAEEKE